MLASCILNDSGSGVGREALAHPSPATFSEKKGLLREVSPQSWQERMILLVLAREND